jgi:aryl-alcohol dehydrogenase-like predicted oxidoreductase
VLITKVGYPMGELPSGLSARHIAQAVEASLRRLQTDRIDLYFSHHPDAKTPIEDTLRAHEALIKAGKVRAIGASNYGATQLREALDAADRNGLPRYQAVQPEYNLYDRPSYEGPLRELSVKEGLGVITYYSLAAGFLSGKYRSEADLGQSVRGGGIKKYLTPRGLRILDALDHVAKAHDAKPAEVALAWVIARDGVTAPIASATSLAQLESLIRSTRLALGADDLQRLEAASAPA